MCLYEVDFALKYDKKGKFFYGEGFKAFRFNSTKDKVMGLNGGVIPRVKRWVDAEIDLLLDGIVNDKYEDGVGYRRYIPGFHIWLTEKDAKTYHNVGTTVKIVPVLFRDVLAYGNNATCQYKDYMKDKYKPCVIARQIKVLSYA